MLSSRPTWPTRTTSSAWCPSTRERFGRLDVLMNNAGLGIGGAIADAETKKLDMQLDVNLRAVYLVTREAIPMLKEAGAERRRDDREHRLDRGQAARRAGSPPTRRRRRA